MSEPAKCACEINKKGECEGCLKQLREISRLFQIVMLELAAKVDWITKTHKPNCDPCVIRYADDLGSFFVKDLAGVEVLEYDRMYGMLVAFLAQQGIVDIPKTTEAYRMWRFKKEDGTARTLDEVLQILYGRK